MVVASLFSTPMRAAMRRCGAKFLSEPSLLLALDFCVAPAIDDFVFADVLRMSERELLTGSTLAALVVNEA